MAQAAPQPAYTCTATIKMITPINAGQGGYKLKLESSTASVSEIVDKNECFEVIVKANNSGVTNTNPPKPVIHGFTIQQEEAYIFKFDVENSKNVIKAVAEEET